MIMIGGDELGCVHPIGSCMDSSILIDVLVVALSDLNKVSFFCIGRLAEKIDNVTCINLV